MHHLFSLLPSSTFFPFSPSVDNADDHLDERGRAKDAPGRTSVPRLENLAVSIIGTSNADPDILTARMNDFGNALLITRGCNAIDLYAIRSRVKPGSQAVNNCNRLLEEKYPDSEANTYNSEKKRAEDLWKFAESLDFSDCLDFPCYLRLPAADRPDDPDVVIEVGPDESDWLVPAFLEDNVSWMPLGAYGTYREIGSFFACCNNNPDVIEMLAEKTRNIAMAFLWGKTGLKTGFFPESYQLKARFPLAFLLEKAWHYPDKPVGFQIASRIMAAMSKAYANSDINASYLYQEARNSVLCKDEFWQKASPQWRHLLTAQHPFLFEQLHSADSEAQAG